MPDNQTDLHKHIGWRDDNPRVQSARQPFSRRVQTLFQIDGTRGFPGLLSEERVKAQIDARGYYTYPLLFYTAFPDVSLAELRKLSLAGSYLFDYILSLDSLIDHAEGLNPARLLLGGMLQQEALSVLYSLFPAESGFWAYFRRYSDHFHQAILQEWVKHRFLLNPYMDEEILFIYSGKAAVGKACIAALAILGGREELIVPLTTSHDYFHVAYQLIDDLQDWELDYRRGQYSYPLTVALSGEGWQKRTQRVPESHSEAHGGEAHSGLPPRPHPDEVAELLKRSGVVEKTRELAALYLGKAVNSIDGIAMNDGSWLAAIEQTRHSLASFQFDMLPGGEPKRAGKLSVPAHASGDETASNLPTGVDWASISEEEIAVPIAASWARWLDPARPPQIDQVNIRLIQRRSLCRSARAATVGEALCQVGLAIAISLREAMEYDLHVHLGVTPGEFEWCRAHRRWLDAVLTGSLDEPACLWTVDLALQVDSNHGWAPLGLGRYLGYCLVRSYFDENNWDENNWHAEIAPVDVLRHYRRQLIA